MNNINQIGSVILQLRKAKGVTQEEVAKFVGVSAQAVSKWENGSIPDTELLPKIADYFAVSIDSLFGRSFADYNNIQTALVNQITDTPFEQRMKLVFNYCWDMERAFMTPEHKIELNSIEDYEREFDENDQQYSRILSDYGFTCMGIANRSQYFLIVPDPKDTDTAYFNAIDYPAFFKDFSDKDVFDACVLLNKRDYEKAFTPNLLMKNMNIPLEKAKEILSILKKYRLIYTSQIEMDDEVQTVYHFNPTPSFVALLIFAREIIDKPSVFSYNMSWRNKPYFK